MRRGETSHMRINDEMQIIPLWPYIYKHICIYIYPCVIYMYICIQYIIHISIYMDCGRYGVCGKRSTESKCELILWHFLELYWMWCAVGQAVPRTSHWIQDSWHSTLCSRVSQLGFGWYDAGCLTGRASGGFPSHGDFSCHLLNGWSSCSIKVAIPGCYNFLDKSIGDFWHQTSQS